MTRLLLGFGLREFSMHPAQLLAIKQQVLRTRVREVEKPAARVYLAHDPAKARALLAKLNA
jgi:phosphotransferase system enzyme I (PtsI)